MYDDIVLEHVTLTTLRLRTYISLNKVVLKRMLEKIIYQTFSLNLYLLILILLFQFKDDSKNIIQFGFKYIILILILFLVIATSFYLIKKKKNDYQYILKNIFISALITTIFYSSVLLIIERSLSVHLLEYVSDESKNITPQNAKDVVFKSWQKDNFQIAKRIEEQIAFGNIELVDNNSYKITAKGLLINNIITTLKNLFNLK
jgi:hypothetical protein